jgi:hypothetical protein
MPRRSGNTRIFELYNRTVVSLAVLGDDRPNWRPDQFHYGRWGCEVGIRFPVVKLLDYAADVPALESNPNPFSAVVLAHLKTRETRQDPDARCIWKVRLIKSLYERGLSKEDVRQLFRLIDWMMDLPLAETRRFWQEMQQYEKEKQVPYITSVERLGIEKGKCEGLIEGKREGLLKALTLGLKLKFGTEGLALMPVLQVITEVDKLETLCDAIESLPSLEEFRQLCG